MTTYAIANGENPGPLQHPAITLVNVDGSPYAGGGSATLTGLRGAAAATDIISLGITADTFNRLIINADASMETGDGTIAPVASLALQPSGLTRVGYNAAPVATGAGVPITAIGYRALVLNTTGGSNVAVGNAALEDNVTGSNNTAVGALALSNVTLSNNTAVGTQALQLSTTGQNNTAIGASAARAMTTGSNNVAIGQDALRLGTTGGNNIGIGQGALRSNLISANNIGIGFEALNLNTGGDHTAVGSQALKANTTGENNTAVGRVALIANTTGSNNVAVGGSSANANTTGADITAVGESCLRASVSAINVTAVGADCLRLSTASNNVAIGSSAGYEPGGDATEAFATTTGAQQTLIGADTGQSSGTASNDIVCLGFRSMCNGHNAIAIGSGVLAGAAGTVAIGRDNAGTSASSTVANEIKLGTALHTVQVIGNASIGGAATNVGFYGTAPIAKQTGVAVTAGGVHAALVALGLIAA